MSVISERCSTLREYNGALQYATITRLEITYSLDKACQFMQAPVEAYWQVVKRILRYQQELSTQG